MSKTWDIRGARGANDQIVTVATVHELEYHGEWMVEEFVTVSILSATPVELRYGDFLDYRGERFYIDYDPSVIKKSSSGSYGEAFTYDNVKLYSSARQLNDTSFRDVVLNDNKLHTAMSVFAFFASSVEDLADRIQANLYRSSSDQWVVFTPNKYRWLQRKPGFIQESVWDSIYGTSDPSAIVGNRDINVECQNLSCTGALVLSYNKFNVPYIVRGHSIIIGAPAVDAGRIFKYGLGNGLYEIERTGEDQQLVTKLYAYGSEENLPLNYYANLHKKTVVKGVRDAKDMGQGLTYYGLKTNTPFGDVKNGLLNADSMCMLSYGGMTMKTFFDPTVYDEEGETQYLYVRFDHDATTGHDEEFYNALGDGEVTITVTGGANINSWPSSLIVSEAQDSYPALLSINKLMLPGFPDMSLNDFVHGAANGDFIMPGYDDLNTSMRVATSLSAHYDFSDSITEPWIRSHLSGTVGLKEGNLYFDGTNNLDDIKPTIEDTGADVVTDGSAITDNGYLADNADASFFLTVASNSVIDWQVAYTKRTEDISLEMKTGYCTGRKFKLLAEPESVDGGWKLKLEREKDTSTSRYFPYRESDTGSYAQVLAGDKFVVTGIDLPKGYVEAASVRLLVASCRELGKIDHPSRTYLPKIDEIYMQRQDDEAKASGGAVQSLHDRLKAGMTLSVLDTDLEISIESTIDVITIKENGNNGIPTYDVVLRNDKEKNLAATVQDQIDKAVGGASDYGMTDMQLESVLERLGDKLFISKKHEDATEYLVTFFAGLIAEQFIKNNDWLKGEWTTDPETGEESNDGKGFSIYNQGINSWHIELDYATVRRLLRAKEIYTYAAHIGEVNNQTVFKQGLQTLGDILLGHYAEGVEGGIITAEGHAELETLITRGLARLQELFVVNDSTFGGNLSSIDFISGFLTGKGWAIQKLTRINPAGVEEEYYAMEIDNLTVRNILRVYEFVVSQLRGENDNYMFAAFLEVHHYDPVTGRVWLKTEQGKFYNPFRMDDCIVVQQYQGENDAASGGDGYITKHYELVITDAGMGGETDVDENGDRLDWVTFKNFTTDMEGEGALSLIKQGDTFVRKDNLTDPERKGVMQIITVGPNTPYMDVAYGLVTDPNDAEKARFGKLDGIRTELFGWLKGFGAYINNLYGVGTIMNAQTGENVQSRFEVTNSNLRSVYKETTYAIEDNLVANGNFQDGFDKWTADEPYGSGNPSSAEQEIFGDGEGSMLVNGDHLATQFTSKSELAEYAGIRVLRLTGSGISQSWSDMSENGEHDELKNDDVGTPNYDAESEAYYKDSGMTPAQMAAAIAAAKAANKAIEDAAEETVTVPDKLYLGVRMLPLTSGRLKVMLVSPNGARQMLFEQNVNSSVQWGLFQSMDSTANPWTWDVTKENGRLRVEYSGECLLRFVAIQNNPLSDTEVEYSTRFEQNARRISLMAMKEDADNRQAYAQIEIKYNQISAVVTNNKQVTDGAITKLTQDLDKEIQDRKNADGTQDEVFATYRRQTDSAIQAIAGHWDSDGHLKGYSTTEQTADAISSGVATANTNAQEYVAALKSLINTDVLSDSGNAYATFKNQTNTSIANIAAKWDGSGNLIGYSTTTQTASMIKTQVESYGYLKSTDAATTYSTKSELTQTANNITQSVAAVSENVQKLEESWEQGSYTRTSGKTISEIKATNSRAIRYTVLIPVTNSTAFYINDDYEVNVVFFGADKKCLGSGSSVSHDGDTGKPLSITVPSNAVYGAVYIYYYDGNLSPSGFRSTGFLVINKEIVTQAYLSLYVDKNSVSWLQGSADNIIFKFSKSFEIQKANGAWVLKLDTSGNLSVKGEITGKVTGDTVIKYSNSSSDGIRITSSGIQRYMGSYGWVNLFAGRFTKDYQYTSNTTKELVNDDDFVFSVGDYNKVMRLPSSPQWGKVITIQNINGTTYVKPNTGHTLQVGTTTIRPTDGGKDLSGYDRAELVYYQTVWYWNYMGV